MATRIDVMQMFKDKMVCGIRIEFTNKTDKQKRRIVIYNDGTVLAQYLEQGVIGNSNLEYRMDIHQDDLIKSMRSDLIETLKDLLKLRDSHTVDGYLFIMETYINDGLIEYPACKIMYKIENVVDLLIEYSNNVEGDNDNE